MDEDQQGCLASRPKARRNRLLSKDLEIPGEIASAKDAKEGDAQKPKANMNMKTPPAKSPSPEKQLAGMVGKFTPKVAALIRQARKKMRRRLPQALELVYDNYNFLVIGFGPSEKASEAIFSLAAHARGVNLCFLQGAGLPDPKEILRGSGNMVRNIRLENAASLDRPEVQELIEAALARAKTSLDPNGTHRLVIKSVSAKQRPRRPVTTKRCLRNKWGG